MDWATTEFVLTGVAAAGAAGAGAGLLAAAAGKDWGTDCGTADSGIGEGEAPASFDGAACGTPIAFAAAAVPRPRPVTPLPDASDCAPAWDAAPRPEWAAGRDACPALPAPSLADPVPLSANAIPTPL
jgi:hypothetical protein